MSAGFAELSEDTEVDSEVDVSLLAPLCLTPFRRVLPVLSPLVLALDALLPPSVSVSVRLDDCPCVAMLSLSLAVAMSAEGLLVVLASHQT